MGLAAAQALLADIHNPIVTSMQSNTETERAELRRVVLNASALRFHAHCIYLRVAVARRWATNRQNILQSQRPGAPRTAQLEAVNNAFKQVSEVPGYLVMEKLVNAAFNTVGYGTSN